MARLGFCAPFNAADPNAQSGSAYSIRRQLLLRGHQVSDLFLRTTPYRLLFAPYVAAARLRDRYYAYDREPLFLSALARAVEAWARKEHLDAVICPTSLPVSRYSGPVPAIIVTDQVFPSGLDAYWHNASPRYRRLGIAQERDALARCTAAVFPSRWAVNAAITECGADPRRLHEIAFGANLYESPAREDVERMLHGRSREHCELIFIGREWHRKGGDLVLATLAELLKLAISCRLTIVGTVPPVALPANVAVVPFIDKQTAPGARRFAALMSDMHFLVTPSRAEAHGRVYCEAAAFAVPSVARAVGGVGDIIRDGETGILLPPEQASAEELARRIATLWSDRDAYIRTALAARDDYERRLNWDRFGERFDSVIQSAVAAPRG